MFPEILPLNDQGFIILHKYVEMPICPPKKAGGVDSISKLKAAFPGRLLRNSDMMLRVTFSISTVMILACLDQLYYFAAFGSALCV